jgi:hypothetical protein
MNRFNHILLHRTNNIRSFNSFSVQQLLSRCFHSSIKCCHTAQPNQSSSANAAATNSTPINQAPAIDPNLLTPPTKPTNISSVNGFTRSAASSRRKSSVRFSIDDSAGALQEALKWFWKHNINMTRLESRPNKRSTDYDFYVDFEGDTTDQNVKNLLKDLKTNARDVNILESRKVPW